MPTRVLVVVLGLAAGAFALLHPTPQAVVQSVAPVHQSRAGNSFTRNGRKPAYRSSHDVLVYVAGAVRRPGLYRIAMAARVDDAVLAAGGLRSDADPVAVNLAAQIEDGEEIAVPKIGETLRIPGSTRSRNSGSRRAHRRRSTASHAMIDLNTANADELAGIPGIGPTVAVRIVQLRTTDGAFQTLDELLDVAGMTQSKLDRASPYLRI
jgi:competence protein ComEA